MLKTMCCLTIVIFFLLVVGKSNSQLLNYYWRDYHSGSIPGDAIIGGKHANGENVYIGRGYLKDRGLIPLQIDNATKKVFAFWGYEQIESKYNQILCGSQDNFKWFLVNSTHLSVLLLGKQPVVGGHSDIADCTPLLIGRIYYHGENKIGKINACEVNNASFYFLDGGVGKTSNLFEVLYLKPELPSIDVRNANIIIK